MKILSPQTPFVCFFSTSSWVIRDAFQSCNLISALLVVQELDSTLRFVVFIFDVPLFPSLQVQDQVDLTLPSALSLASIFVKNWCWTDAQLGTLFQNLSDMKCSRKYAYLITWLIDCHLEHSLLFAKVEYPTRATWMDLPGVVLQPIAQDQWLRLFMWLKKYVWS